VIHTNNVFIDRSYLFAVLQAHWKEELLIHFLKVVVPLLQYAF